MNRNLIYGIVTVAIVLGAFGTYAVLNLHSQSTSPLQPHLIFVASVTSHTYNDAFLTLTSPNRTTIVKYDVWCDSDKYTKSVSWIFGSNSMPVDVYSAATPSNHYADFGGSYMGQPSTSPMNPYHLTLYSSDGLSTTINFVVS